MHGISLQHAAIMHALLTSCLLILADDCLQRLDTAAVIGVVVAVLVVMVFTYTCGMLSGALVQRKRGNTTCTSAPTSPEQSVPVYEEVHGHPSVPNIPLHQNAAYSNTAELK